MAKTINRLPRWIFSSVSLLTALLVLFAYATQAMNIQVIFIQPIYWTLDPAWGPARTAALLLAALGGFAAWRFDRRGSDDRTLMESTTDLFNRLLRLSGVIAAGMILGLLIFYAHSCCENPILFYLGFPLSWLRGAAPDWPRLTLPAAPYLIQNLGRIGWGVEGFSLAVDLLFWGNLAFLLFTIRTRHFFSKFKAAGQVAPRSPTS